MTREQRAAAEAERVLGCRSPLLLEFFARVFAHHIRSSFHALRVLCPVPATIGDRPLIVYANHPSWWDGAIFIWMSARLFGDRHCFSPMEAAAIERYRFFGRIGAFPVRTGTLEGAATFLAVAQRVLGLHRGMLLMNAGGRFADVRDRPVALAPGLAHLVKRFPDAVFVPLAMEHVFWDERRPNALLHFGAPVPASSLASLAPADALGSLAGALERTMDELAIAARARDATPFTTLIAGREGINALYDGWRRLRAGLRGERFRPAHGDQA